MALKTWSLSAIAHCPGKRAWSHQGWGEAREALLHTRCSELSVRSTAHFLLFRLCVSRCVLSTPDGALLPGAPSREQPTYIVDGSHDEQRPERTGYTVQ